ncbi:alpha/beta fold hydrolase [Paenibacillus prosopidis]|uniref:Pimeloyl-ACP methyl ester carboxylesterase n=1 Tax=Paenibacillus prosopidis TaxID=630520 RepID=A0A368VMW9_9BACL|nr:alpha/beta hydrolase [Paenibacillus prosopidis]RCW41884.1 pimeloyl-ACP methyl ester carboxylesterase [Paenibacillus prosopidis]
MPEMNINGYSMQYSDRGKGTTILFIHPPLLTSLNFVYQIQELSAQFRTVAFNIRGHGGSEPSVKEITYPLIVEDMKQLMDRLQIEEAFICGYSTGGSIALEFMLTHPDRALGCIVVSGMSEVSDWKLRNEIKLGRSFSRIGAVRTLAMSISWAQANRKLSLVWKLYNDAIKGNANNIKQYYQYSLRYNCTGRLEQIHQPVLLVYGEKDKQFHPYAKLLSQRLDKNELYFIKQTNHQIPTKAAGQLNGLIRQFIVSQMENR